MYTDGAKRMHHGIYANLCSAALTFSIYETTRILLGDQIKAAATCHSDNYRCIAQVLISET
jgi:hypothetical protein